MLTQHAKNINSTHIFLHFGVPFLKTRMPRMTLLQVQARKNRTPRLCHSNARDMNTCLVSNLAPYFCNMTLASLQTLRCRTCCKTVCRASAELSPAGLFFLAQLCRFVFVAASPCGAHFPAMHLGDAVRFACTGYS